VQNVTYFEVEIDVTDKDASLLRPRMSGDADIVTEVIEDALIVPETALRYRGAETYVQLANGAGEPTEAVVEIGIVDGSRVQLLGGVEPGQQVILQ
jgi:HlyD family secretion protein